MRGSGVWKKVKNEKDRNLMRLKDFIEKFGILDFYFYFCKYSLLN